MNRTTLRNTLAGIALTAAALALGYFGVQYFGKNNMFTIAAAVGGAGAISYVLGITVPKRENCTLRVKALPSKYLSPSLFYSTHERLFTLN